MKKTLYILSICFAVSCGQKYNNEAVIAFYNVENLFDTIDAPDKVDEEFMPESKKAWDTQRYNKKLNDLAMVIDSIDATDFPEVVGLCEVENAEVVNDLVSKTQLKEAGYAVVHEESPDFRGIDNALIYRKDFFTYENHEAIKVTFDGNPNFKTRDILHVKGKIGTNEVHFFVNHWSSRRGGEKKSAPKRIAAAKLLKTKVEAILQINPKANIIIMGDMNDEPQNESLAKALGAANSVEGAESELYNLMYAQDLKNIGTYSYRGNWNMLDNLIVSKAVLNGESGLKAKSKEGTIFSLPWMYYVNKEKGVKTPTRTYGGPNYYGGISDHLPVCFTLQY